MLFAESVYFLILITPELNLVAVVNVFHAAPRGITLNIALILRHAKFRSALLKLYSITARESGALNKFFGNIHRPVMIDADFSDNKYGMSIPYDPVPYGNFRHIFTLDKTCHPFLLMEMSGIAVNKTKNMLRNF